MDENDATYNNTNETSVKGKIVGLTEATEVGGNLNSNEITDGIDSETDGATATKNLIVARKDDTDFANNYPAFEWVYTTVNSGNINNRWYLPAKDELVALYGTGGATKATVNASLATVSGAAPLSDNFYWSSTQVSSVFAWDVDFRNGSTANCHKDATNSVRVISAFW